MALNLMARLRRRHSEEGWQGLARAAGSRFGVRPRAHPIHAALRRLIRQESLTVVQIGAHVGDTDNDPIFHVLTPRLRDGALAGRLKLILVEPIGEFFTQLQKNYQGMAGVIFENVAIAPEPGKKEFYRVAANPAEHGFPDWLTQLGSLDPNRLLGACDFFEHVSKDNAAMVEFMRKHRSSEMVDCITITELLRRNGAKEVDLLQIDAEGYDFEILKTLDFRKVRPRYINYERVLLQAEEPACRKMLVEAGYRLMDFGEDTFCVRK